MSIEPDVDLVICLASGFGNKAYTRSDIRHIYRHLRQSYIRNDTEFHYDVWNGRWKDTAQRLHQVCTRNARCIFIAHSWGCGHGYRVFEKAWRKCGRTVDLAILIDPIPRPFRIFVPGNLFALTSWGKIKVKNAHAVLAFRQVNARPMGRRVVNGPGTQIDRMAFGTGNSLDKYAPFAIGAGRIIDGDVTHNTIDADERVQQRIFETLDSKITAWRDGK